MKKYYSNGKLLLTGEYLVLDGALALALPTKLGQSLQVKPGKVGEISWTSFDKDQHIWLEASISLSKGFPVLKGDSGSSSVSNTNKEHLEKLAEILLAAHELNPSIFNSGDGFIVETHLDFDRTWGLGSSSTLINNIAQWFKVDPYILLEKTFGGSGYDIASANHDSPITFTKTPNGPRIFSAAFDPLFKENLFFVHLNRKQNSRNSIAQYKRQSVKNLSDSIEKINSLTQQFIASTSLKEFELLLEIHETIISQILGTPKVKDRLFHDYPGMVKSLGGWGGDFILATGGEAEKAYFKKKGYTTILNYSELIL